MTREEVIYCLQSYQPDAPDDMCLKCPYYGSVDNGNGVYTCKSAEARSIAIEVLSQSEFCTGAISKQAVLDAIEDSNKNKDFKYFISKNAAKCFRRIIRDLPPVTPIEKVGYWVLTPTGGLIIDDWGRIAGVDTTSYDISCSNCGKGYHESLPDNGKTYKGTPYCPRCGAKIFGVKMEGEE